MKEYHKIQTVFLRDPETKFKTLLDGEWATPEFEYLQECRWVFTEKVDGTNVRLIWDGSATVEYRGKTDRAVLPQPLVDWLDAKAPDFSLVSDGAPMTLYGEGYGAKIQKGGCNYGDEQKFVLFDARVGDFWLKREAVEDIAKTLGLDVVPIIGHGTLREMVNMVSEGFKSQWGDFTAEGIVARPAVDLLARDGSRIITKLKYKDFRRGAF